MADGTTVKEAIRDVLIGDTTLMGLMGGPAAPEYNVFYLMPPDPPRFPQIVFWIGFGSAAPIDRPVLASTGELNVNVWAKTNVCADIAERVVYLLHHAKDLGARIVLEREPQELYDDELDAYGLNTVFSLFHRRSVA